MAINFPAPTADGQEETINGVLWVCEDADLPAQENVRWMRRGNAISEAQPIGSFIHFGGVTLPAGYLSCDGSAHLKTDYPELYVAIGDRWANTGGATNPPAGSFRVPPQEVDGLGLYLRGDGDTTVVGEYQGDVFKEHTHVVPGALAAAAGGGGRTLSPSATNNASTLSTGNPTETRPRSITTLLCIKATYSAFTGDIGNVPINSVGAPQLVDEAVNPAKTDIRAMQVAGLMPTAWCTFDGTLTGTNPPTAGGGIVSVTRTGTGQYTINFTVDMDNINFSATVTSTSAVAIDNNVNKPRTISGWSIRIRDSAFNNSDANIVGVHVFGGLV